MDDQTGAALAVTQGDQEAAANDIALGVMMPGTTGWIALKNGSGRYNYHKVRLDQMLSAIAIARQAGIAEGLERARQVAEEHAETSRQMHNASAKDRDTDGCLVHGEAWRVGREIAAAIRTLSDEGAAKRDMLDQLAAKDARIAELEAGLRDWRSIESAPKDGTIIDVWRDGSRETVSWGFRPHCCGEMGQYCDSDWHGEKTPGWVCATFGEFVGGKHDPFTHWMPLPAAPCKDTSHD